MPALKRNRCNFLFVSITDLGNRLQQQKAEFFGGGLGDACLNLYQNLYQKGLLLIRPLSMFLTVDATDDFSCYSYKLLPSL